MTGIDTSYIPMTGIGSGTYSYIPIGIAAYITTYFIVMYFAKKTGKTYTK